MIGSGFYTRQRNDGFTIVEVVVIVVVIGILVALTSVSYMLITQRTLEQAVKGDLQKFSTAMNTFKSENGAYPSVLSQLDFQPGEGITYQYSYTSTNDSYCATATGKGVDAFIKNGSRATENGGCPGHGVKGVAAITNAAPNPSFETGINGADKVCGPSATCTLSRDTAVKYSGSASARLQWASTPTGEPYIIIGGAEVKPGDSYTCSAYARSTWSTTLQLRTVTHTSIGTWQTQQYGASFASGISQWKRASVVNPSVPTGGVTASCLLVVPNGATMPPVNASLYIDAVMLTVGSTLYSYADGTSPNWVWNGATHASSSTGPVQ